MNVYYTINNILHPTLCSFPIFSVKIRVFYFENTVKLPSDLTDDVKLDARERKSLSQANTRKQAERPAAMGIKLYYTTVTASRTVSQEAAFGRT